MCILESRLFRTLIFIVCFGAFCYGSYMLLANTNFLTFNNELYMYELDEIYGLGFIAMIIGTTSYYLAFEFFGDVDDGPLYIVRNVFYYLGYIVFGLSIIGSLLISFDALGSLNDLSKIPFYCYGFFLGIIIYPVVLFYIYYIMLEKKEESRLMPFHGLMSYGISYLIGFILSIIALILGDLSIIFYPLMIVVAILFVIQFFIIKNNELLQSDSNGFDVDDILDIIENIFDTLGDFFMGLGDVFSKLFAIVIKLVKSLIALIKEVFKFIRLKFTDYKVELMRKRLEKIKNGEGKKGEKKEVRLQ